MGNAPGHCPICTLDFAESHERKEDGKVTESLSVCGQGHYKMTHDHGVTTFTIFGRDFVFDESLPLSRNKNKSKKMRQHARRYMKKDLTAWYEQLMVEEGLK